MSTIITAGGFETTEARSKLMSHVRATETKSEVRLRKALWANGIRYRKNYKLLPGTPDIAIVGARVAVFVDGEFWHGYDWLNVRETLRHNREYWLPKIERTIERDALATKSLEALGWQVIRFWEREVRGNLYDCVVTIQSAVATRR